jgi:hypothetical protein
MYRRAIVVLSFAAATAALMVVYPGPLFTGASHSEPNFSERFSGAMPMDFDDPQTIELHAKAKSALNELVAMQAKTRALRAPMF